MAPKKRVAPKAPKLRVEPATPDRWSDVETLFGKNGACGGCWCQFFKRTAKAYVEGSGEGNKRALKRSVTRGESPGLLAYDGDVVVGWCALEPRENFPRLARSRLLKTVELPESCWSVPCFYVARTHRRRGVTRALLEAAATHARAQGAAFIEGYPVAPKKDIAPPFAYHGVASAFEKAGFDEVAAPSPTRRVMRKRLRVRRRT
jgi:GNAT superfamily N-acetyltransferase